MTPRSTVAAVLIPVILATGVGLTRARSADEAKPADGIDYSKWTALTPEPVAVHQEVFTRCISTPATEKKIKDLKGREGPHFTPGVKLFANAEAEKALKADLKAALPVGSTIVKEKFSDTKGALLLAYGAMIKREKGYDPEHGDWEYVYADLVAGAKPKIERGKIASCIRCHSIAKDRDYLYRKHLGAAEKK
jgi:hypothetical protein